MTDTQKIVLMGHPNIGKSVVFSRLTGTRVISANYPGTTVDIAEGILSHDGGVTRVVDAPGTYSLQSCSRTEEVAVQLFRDADVVVNVVDATNLERNLFFTLELLETGKPMIVALNMWDEARHKGIQIDAGALERKLGVPVVPTVALTGEGIRDLVGRLPPRRVWDGQ